MPLIYRVMTRDGNYPKVGDARDELGVRPNVDLPVRGGMVVPLSRGMSVAPAWRLLPYFLIPKRLKHLVHGARGTNRGACWRFGIGDFNSGDVADGLRLCVTSPKHGVVEPAMQQSLADFQARLAATRDSWTIDEQ